MPEHHGAKVTGGPETSESEEMYLLTILRSREEGHEGPLALAVLGARLGVSAASVNEMIRKLAVKGLVTYEPYKGAALTPPGEQIAATVLRTRRLWARFLVDRLGFTPHEADEMACDLEHVTTGEAADRLAEFLGHPDSGPLGGPIPQVPATDAAPSAESLALVPAGSDVEVVAVAAGPQVSGFLSASGIAPGTTARLVATGAEGVLIEGTAGAVHIDSATAAAVLVKVRRVG